jgi:hypothetical protein
MDAVSSAGLVGAVLGAIIGWIDYKVVGGFVERKLRETDRSQNAAEKADYERRIGIFRKLLFLSTLGMFPIVGYFVGHTIAR